MNDNLSRPNYNRIGLKLRYLIKQLQDNIVNKLLDHSKQACDRFVKIGPESQSEKSRHQSEDGSVLPLLLITAPHVNVAYLSSKNNTCPSSGRPYRDLTIRWRHFAESHAAPSCWRSELDLVDPSKLLLATTKRIDYNNAAEYEATREFSRIPRDSLTSTSAIFPQKPD